MLFYTFTATGYSPPFYALQDGFDLIFSMTGTNSALLEREVVNGTWVTFGSAITSAGTVHRTGSVDYVAPVRLRVNLGTKDTGSVVLYLEGDYLAAESDTQSTDPNSLLMEDGDDLLMESGDYLFLEAA